MDKAVRLMVMSFALISLLSFAVPVFADTESPPRDYVKETENGEYVFVMLAPEEWSRYQDSTIRKTYRQSGLYRNDGSTTPLWTVYWYSFLVYPSSDGRHVVCMGPWASDVEQLGVAFYRDGKELKAYRIKDLVRDESRLRHTVSHFFWRTSLEFNDKKGILLLKTTDDQSYRFSIRTGEIEGEENGKGVGASKGTGNETDKTRQQRQRVILDGPVRVTAKVLKEQPSAGEVGGSYEIELTVQKGEEKFAIRTDLIGVNSAEAALETQKKGTRWNGRYLFVRTECGGGNAWRCNRDSLYMVRSGRLRLLGEVFAGDRDEPAQSYKEGHFWDIYDKFEMNGLTDHATAPAFRIALREKTGDLRVNLDRTWAENQADFKRRATQIEALIKRKVQRRANGRELEHLVLSNAVLAKYCGRENEAVPLISWAELHFEPDRLAIFRNILSHVKPGEYPVLSDKD